MKNRMLGVIVPILAGAALIGTGFSTWYFTSGSIENAKDAFETNISSMAEYGSLTLKRNSSTIDIKNYSFELTLDASTKEGDTITDQGIHLMGYTGSSDAKEYDANDFDDVDASFSYTANDDSITDSIKNIRFTATITLTADLCNYISVDTTTGTTNSDAITQENSWKKSEENNYTFTFTTEYNLNKTGEETSIDIDVPSFGFYWIAEVDENNNTKEPSNPTEWEDLKGIASSKVSISYNLSLAD